MVKDASDLCPIYVKLVNDMVKRAIRASKEGLEKAKFALSSQGWTQEYLAGMASCTRQTINKFFKGQPVDKSIFLDICKQLGLVLDEIAEFEIGVEEAPQFSEIDEIVQAVRERIHPAIYQRCGTMRVLDMNQPIELDDIYTSVNILEKITGRRRLAIGELLLQASSENFDRLGLGKIYERRVLALEAVSKFPKLMIIGKPGAGKTTFLKHLAMQCIDGTFQPNKVPSLIILKDFAEAPNQPSLKDYLNQLFDTYDTESSKTLDKLLKKGRLLILLDSLDEVRDADSNRVFKQIRDFTDQFYQNQFVITCRIAAQEYTFEDFTEVEIADFDNQQIVNFAQKWFLAKSDSAKANRFIQKLADEASIYELATNPLLLTLLCLVFEESGSFPVNRAELFKEGIDVLLKKWDAKRNIERDQVYKNLSIKRKEDLLGLIALETFEQGHYFFKQKEVEKYISNYIRNLPDASEDPEVLQLDSESILKSIEAQHGLLVERARGIYSFSHLTFQEYFAARKIASSSEPDKTLPRLVSHIVDKRWREIFLLVVGIMDTADPLLQLMKCQTDNLLAADEKLQQFMAWIYEKSRSVKASYKPAVVRAFYFSLTVALARNRINFSNVNTAVPRINHSPNLDQVINQTFDLSIDHVHKFNQALEPDLEFDFNLARAFDQALCLNFDEVSTSLLQAIKLTSDKKLKLQLQKLQYYLSNSSSSNQEKNYELSEIDYKNWIDNFKDILIQYRNIGQSWQFNDEQKILIGKYYDANKLLVDCLNSDCYVSRKVRQEIEDTLLLAR